MEDGERRKERKKEEAKRKLAWNKGFINNGGTHVTISRNRTSDAISTNFHGKRYRSPFSEFVIEILNAIHEPASREKKLLIAIFILLKRCWTAGNFQNGFLLLHENHVIVPRR